ncbi:MAG: hypothetical protein VZR54_07025 [Ruminococcus sp.]|nr:hypothetical protein [Ruminococcus sp.]
MELGKKPAENIDELRKELEELMSDEEALAILKSTNIFINLGRRNGKLKAYIALYKAYHALEDKVKSKEAENEKM